MSNKNKYSNANLNSQENNRPQLDLTFIANEPGKTLKSRFEELI